MDCGQALSILPLTGVTFIGQKVRSALNTQVFVLSQGNRLQGSRRASTALSTKHNNQSDKGSEYYMATKKKGLSHIYPKDRRAMSILAKSGACSRDTFHKMEISDNRILSYKQASFIKEVSIPDKHGPGCKTYFELTEKAGKNFCHQECGIQKFISNGNATVHNAAVSAYLAENLNKKELETVMSERELKPFLEDRLQEYHDRNDERYDQLMEGIKNHTLSMPDVVYKTEQGTYLAIEITTDSYGQAEIDAKIETCELLGLEVTFVHT